MTIETIDKHGNTIEKKVTVRTAAEVYGQQVELPEASYDCDAQPGHRTKTYENKTTWCFGYQAIGFARAGQIGVDEPLLMERLRVVPGNQNGFGETMDVFDDYNQAGTPLAEVLIDRGFSNTVVENWAALLEEKGIRQVIDIHPNDHGARPHLEDGYLMIDGRPHCPSTPEELKVIPRPANLSLKPLKKNATLKQRTKHALELEKIADYNRDIAERDKYMFVEHGKTSSGKIRIKCPARAGKLKCDGCPMSQFLPEPVPVVISPKAPDGQTLVHKACRQETLTLDPEASLKLRQEHVWGSPEWQTSYARRSRIEGLFGLLKAMGTGNIKRGWTRQVGLVKTSFLLAIAAMSVNLTQLLLWAKRNDWTGDPLVVMDVTSHGHADLDEHGQPIGNLPPPPRPPGADAV